MVTMDSSHVEAREKNNKKNDNDEYKNEGARAQGEVIQVTTGKCAGH